MKQGDWVIFELKIGQIKEVRENGNAIFSDGFCETSGRLMESFRPLTLRGKRIIYSLDFYYEKLRKMDGEAGFNYPDIRTYFARLALEAIDSEAAEKGVYEKAQEFVRQAGDYRPVIDGVRLFRPKLG